jgi:AcrR family transcriptional regulator
MRAAVKRESRLDARRNRSLILASAHALFQEFGMSISMRQVAHTAGVGNATLFRHFSTRDQLILAAYEEKFGDLLDLRPRYGTGRGALRAWMKELLELLGEFPHVARALVSPDGATDSQVDNNLGLGLRRSLTQIMAQELKADTEAARTLADDVFTWLVGSSVAGCAAPDPHRDARLVSALDAGLSRFANATGTPRLP